MKLKKYQKYEKLIVVEVLFLKIINKIYEHIIMPFFNRNYSIRKSIRSIQNQNFKLYEILLIDDKSTDTSLEIVGNLSNSYKRIKIIKEKKIGCIFFKSNWC